MKIIIPGEFTTLNEYIDAERGNKFAAAELKKQETLRVEMETLDIDCPRFNYPLDLTVFWYRRNRRSDPDNVSFAIKFILDGLQQSEILDGDGWKHINSICHVFVIDKDDPRVEIFFEDLGEPVSSGYYADSLPVGLVEMAIDF